MLASHGIKGLACERSARLSSAALQSTVSPGHIESPPLRRLKELAIKVTSLKTSWKSPNICFLRQWVQQYRSLLSSRMINIEFTVNHSQKAHPKKSNIYHSYWMERTKKIEYVDKLYEDLKLRKLDNMNININVCVCLCILCIQHHSVSSLFFKNSIIFFYCLSCYSRSHVSSLFPLHPAPSLPLPQSNPTSFFRSRCHA